MAATPLAGSELAANTSQPRPGSHGQETPPPATTIHGTTRIHNIPLPHRHDMHTAQEDTLIFLAHQARLECLTAIRPMHRLIKCLQKHRGASTGVLAGNPQFMRPVAELQTKIERLFVALEYVIRNREQAPVRSEDIYKLNNDWLTIKHGWQDDNVIENFEFHSHLISQLHRMSWQAVKRLFLDHPLNSQNPGLVQPISADREFIQFTLHELPEAIELLAKLRGLATHCAVTGLCDEHHTVRLQYLTRKVKQSQQQLIETTKSFNRTTTLIVPNLPYLIAYELKVENLLAVIRDEVLSEPVTASGEELFSLASNVIDVYVEITEQGINALEQGIKQEVDAWLK